MAQQVELHVYQVTSVANDDVAAVNPVSPLARQLVSDVMTRSVVSVAPLATVREIAAAMAAHRISSVPVLDENRHVLGVVTASDLLARISGERGRPPRGHRLAAPHEITVKSRALTAQQLMTSPAVTTTEYEPIHVAAAATARGKVRCLPVVDEAGVLIGIVTKSDLVKFFLRSDEAIRSDIVDHVLGDAMLLERGTVEVAVHDGVVRLHGELERKLLELQLLERIWNVAGVLGVENSLTYRVDDTVVTRVGPVGGY